MKEAQTTNNTDSFAVIKETPPVKRLTKENKIVFNGPTDDGSMSIQKLSPLTNFIAIAIWKFSSISVLPRKKEKNLSRVMNKRIYTIYIQSNLEILSDFPIVPCIQKFLPARYLIIANIFIANKMMYKE